jgi:hypothetical protein
MIDTATQKKITVSFYGEGPPYIIAPLDRLRAVESILRDNHVSFWTDSEALSLNGQPEVVFVNLERGTSVAQVQRLLDDAR